MNIYLKVEIKKREFISRFLLGLEAAKSGKKVYIGDIDTLIRKKLIQPGLYHDKASTPKLDRINKFKTLRKKGFILTSQDEEAGCLHEAEEYVHSRYNNASLNLVNGIFTWGKFDYDNLSKYYKKFKKKLYNTGNPRVDFWRKDFKKYFDNKKKYILISSNFDLVFGSKNLLHHYKILDDGKYYKRGMSEKILFERMMLQSKISKELIFIIKKIAQKNKNFSFLYRPHPVEDKNYAKTLFKHCKNVKVDGSGSISDMIAGAKLVIHNGCTGGFESSARFVPTVSYMPFKYKNKYQIADRVSLICKTENSLIKVIKRYYNTNNDEFRSINRKEIEYRLDNIRNDLSYKRIARIWDKLTINLKYKKNNNFIILLYCNYLKLKRKFNLNYNNNIKFEPFNYKEIFLLKKKLSLIDNDFAKIKVKIFGDKIIYIFKD